MGRSTIGPQLRRRTASGHLGIERGGLELLVSEQDLDAADFDLLLEQMGGESMSERVHGDALVDVRGGGGLMHDAIELPRGKRIHRIQARKQPAAREDLALGSGCWPPGAQPFEQERWQQRVAILAALALFDTQHHALTIDLPPYNVA